MIENHISEKQFNFIQERDKIFIIEFTKELEKMGYTYGGEIGSGYCGENICLFLEKQE